MAIYAHPRATIDIDLLIAYESFDEVMMIAADLGYTNPGLEMTFVNGEVEIRRVPKIHQGTGQVLSLVLLLVTSAVRTIWDTRVNAEWEGGNLSVVSREGLIALTRKRGSAQDLADIQAWRTLTVRKIDMSSEAITARLKLVSQLHRLCLSLQNAKITPRAINESKDKNGRQTAVVTARDLLK